MLINLSLQKKKYTAKIFDISRLFCSRVFIASFEDIPHFFLVFLFLLTLNNIYWTLHILHDIATQPFQYIPTARRKYMQMLEICRILQEIY